MNSVIKVLVTAALAGIALTMTQSVAQEITFTATYSGSDESQTVKFNQPTRFAELLSQTVFSKPASAQTALYWPGSRLSSNKLQRDLQQQRAQLVAELNQLASYWSKRGRVDIERSVNYLARELEQMKLQAGYKFAIEPDRVRVNLQENPLLGRSEGTEYELLIPSHIAGISRDGVPAEDPHADSQWQWQIALNGNIKKHPTGLSNRHNNALCFQHNQASPLTARESELCEPSDEFTIGKTFVGLSEQVTPENWQSVNRRIAEIVKHSIK